MENALLMVSVVVNHFAKCCRQTIAQVKNEQDSYSDTTDGSDIYIG